MAQPLVMFDIQVPKESNTLQGWKKFSCDVLYHVSYEINPENISSIHSAVWEEISSDTYGHFLSNYIA